MSAKSAPKKDPKDYYGVDPKNLPNKSMIPTPDGQKWEIYDNKWVKVPDLGNFGKILCDDSVIIIDPINILPGEKCTCGRPKTEIEKTGIYTYGDYLKKYCIKGKTTNPYGRNLKFANSSESGLGVVIRNFEKHTDNTKTAVPIAFKKRSNQRVGDVLIRF